MNPKTLQGKTALITGAAVRIGRATALSLAGLGADIVVHYNRSHQQAHGLCDELKAQHQVRAWAIPGDFDTPKGYGQLVDQALQAAGRLDILVNNASSFPEATLNDLSYDEFITDLRVNAWAPFELARTFARTAGQGHIINLLDSRVWGYDWKHVGYILSKHVLTVLTRMLALDLAPRFAVNGVAPGLILPPPGQDPTYLDRLVHTVPLKRHGDAGDIADAIAFLASSRFITGQVIFVDGGRHLKEHAHGQDHH